MREGLEICMGASSLGVGKAEESLKRRKSGLLE